MLLVELYNKHKEVLNYLVFGVLTTVLSLAIYYLLTISILDPNNAFQLQIANILSWVAGFLFAYVTNRKFVFESKNKKILHEFVMFFLSRVSTLILDMLIMFIFVTILKYNNQIMKLISQVLVILGNYIFSKCIVFNKKS